MRFAKLFEYPDVGQVLIKVDGDDENIPEIRYWFDAGVEGLGITSIAYQYEESDKGWDLADEVFSKLDKDNVKKLIDKIIKDIEEMTK